MERKPGFGRKDLALVTALAAALAEACGGGGGGGDSPSPPPPPPPPPAPTVLKGVAAVGAPLAGATITVIDGDSTTADPAAVTAGSDGSYTINVSGLKAPLVVKASGTVEGAPVQSLAVVPALTANADNTANVTPLTNAVAALVAPGGDPQALLTPATLAANGTPAKVANAAALVVNTLATDTQIAAALGANFNPLSTPFTANGSGIDGVLDALSVDVTPAGVSITNLAAPVGSSGQPAAVTLTPAQAATPTVVPTLPSSAGAGNVPTAAELAALGAKIDACLALPLAQRVTQDAGGTVTAVLPTCNFAPNDWRSNGRTWAQEVGQYTFAKPQFSGARIGKGSVVLTLAPENETDAKTFKHPYCNSGPCVVVRYPVTHASGRVSSGDWVLGKVGGAWNFVGNQRPYRVFVEPRLNRYINANRDGAAPGNTAEAYFFADRYESVLRLVFDLNSPGQEDVRNARITGPGLPAAGVVLARSQRCATDDRLAIVYQNGATRTPNGSLLFWSGGSAADFVLDAARLDGSALTMPTPVLNNTTVSNQNYAPAPVANQSTAIPAWSRYKVEIFRFSSASDVPDEVINLRISTPAENAANGTTKPWPTLADSFINDFLKPTGAQSTAVTAVGGSLNWAAASGSYVGSGWLFGQNFATATNSENETATFAKRGRLDYEPAAYGDTSAAATAFADPRAGTSMSSFTSSSGTNPNPRCAQASVVALTTSISDYREAGLSFRGSDRKLYNAIWMWDN